MKTLNTALGNVEIINVAMNRASGYGQYTIATEIVFEGNGKTINIHSTDSQLFDKLTDLENNSERTEYLLANQKFTIESAIDDYINSL